MASHPNLAQRPMHRPSPPYLATSSSANSLLRPHSQPPVSAPFQLPTLGSDPALYSSASVPPAAPPRGASPQDISSSIRFRPSADQQPPFGWRPSPSGPPGLFPPQPFSAGPPGRSPPGISPPLGGHVLPSTAASGPRGAGPVMPHLISSGSFVNGPSVQPSGPPSAVPHPFAGISQPPVASPSVIPSRFPTHHPPAAPFLRSVAPGPSPVPLARLSAPFSVPTEPPLLQHSISSPPASPYESQPWFAHSQQVAPPPLVTGQPPRMLRMMPPPLPSDTMTAIPHGVAQTETPLSGQSKIDPNQIPRPIPSSSVVFYETRQGNQANIPPPATSDFIVKDTGNCSPRYMRCTINQIPCTADLLNTSGMQLSLLVQPLALPHPAEEPLQVVDFGETGPLRCSRCKGYVNPFMKFIDQGRRFICNLCGFTDETPREYHCNLGPDGRRRDADERPELCKGTVEFVATREYMVRDPMPAAFFFLIDVSMNAVQTGATAAACGAIDQVISDLPEGPHTLVGVATFDSTIHFYNLKRALQQPLMLIIPDVQDVYTPLESDVVVPLPECRQHLEMLLQSIPTMFQNNKIADSAFGAAMKAAFLAIKNTGGKLLAFQSVLPSIGVGALSSREVDGRINTSAGDKEAHKLLHPADKTMKAMAAEFAEYQVCVDIFAMSQSYVDVASVSMISKSTGGQMYYYYPFSALTDPGKLYNDLRWNITRPQGFEAVMRVRSSQGLQVQEYSGNFCKRIPTDVDLPGIDCDKTIMVTLKHDDKLQDGSECSFQCALLYTSVYGERRIRVSTLSLPCTSVLSNLFRSADLDTQFACMLKQAANQVLLNPLVQVREQVTGLCISILHSYRKYCATVSSSVQLILPEALKLLPLYSLALIKSTGLRTDARVDDRSFWMNHVSSLSSPLAISLVHPRMIAVHDLDSSRESDGSVIPLPIPLSSEHVSEDGVYLLENGVQGLIFIGSSANPDVLRQLFGFSSPDEIPSQFVLQQFENPLSATLNEVVNEIRRQRSSYLRFKLCKKGDQSGILFYSYMVEDKSPAGLSYVEFLVHVHRQIQSKMA